jgi:hypothetical protein
MVIPRLEGTEALLVYKFLPLPVICSTYEIYIHFCIQGNWAFELVGSCLLLIVDE